MIPLADPASNPPIQMAAIIRRAEIGEIEAICDTVWALAEASPAAAHWSRAAYRGYWATEVESGARHAKAMFLACVGTEAGRTSPISRENPNAVAGQIVGFAAFSAVTSVGTGECTLENMAVAEEWRKLGIGRRLLSAGTLWCRAHAAGRVFLEVRETNQAAIALYERAGFTGIGSRPGYYSDPVEAALQMQKLLHPAAQGG